MTFRPDELRGFHGRWSTSASGRKVADRSDAAARAAGKRGTTARSRKSGVTGSAAQVHAAFQRRQSGQPLSEADRNRTEHAAVKGAGSFWDRMRQANADRAQGVVHVKSSRESVRTARAAHQVSHGGLHVHPGGTRTGVKQSFTGKAVAVRGQSGVAMKSPKRSARDIMSAKPAAPKAPIHQQYTRKDLVLKSDAWIREQLTARGVAIPKGARTKALVNLLASD